MHERRVAGTAITLLLLLAASGCPRDAATPGTTPSPPPTEERACADGPACAALGDRHATGDGVPRDPAQAVVFYTVGCELGHGPACGGLARHVLIGRGTAQDSARGVALLDQACTAGDPPACLDLAGAYDGFYRTVADPDRARAARDRRWTLLEAACDQGDLDACRLLAFSYDFAFDDHDDDPARARTYYAKLCDRGDAQGCARVADRLRHSDVPEDQARARALGAQAVKAFEAECAGGNPRSCAQLRQLYVLGRWVPLDPDKVNQLELQACEAGEVAACDFEASAFREGTTGHPEDAARAAELTARGSSLLAADCDRGDGAACVALAFRSPLGTGRIAEADAAQLALLERACEEGAPDGCDAAAHAYRHGNGTSPDEARAAALEARACTLAKVCDP